MNPTQCTVDGCDTPVGDHGARGMCHIHYKRAMRNGEIEPLVKTPRTCTVEGCGRKRLARGLCSRHYGRLMATGTTDRVPKITECIVEDCDSTDMHGRGLCNAHYRRWQYLGTTELPSRPSVEERLEAGLVRQSNGCLEWTGGRGPRGYGKIMVAGEHLRTHRVAWELANGPIPDGLWVLHRCDNPPCCDVGHLWLGTHVDNQADKAAKGRSSNGRAIRTHCKHGHPYDAANTYVTPQGHRVCRACRAKRLRNRNRKQGST